MMKNAYINNIDCKLNSLNKLKYLRSYIYYKSINACWNITREKLFQINEKFKSENYNRYNYIINIKYTLILIFL